MIELHGHFESWLADGATADLPRDVALHASACDGCLRSVAALDALAAIDLASQRAPEFGSPIGQLPRRSLAAVRSGAAGIVMTLAIAGIAVVASEWPSRASGPPQAALASPSSTPRDGVLGERVTPAAAPTPSGTAASTDPSRSAEPLTSPPQEPPERLPAASRATPRMTPSPPSVTASPIATLRPTGLPTPSPTPAPTLVATPDVTPTPTAAPTETPSPEATLDPDESAERAS